MHWWKKFLSNFFSDKTNDKPSELHIEDQPENEQHEMKTRMIYQYPKGEFRFPLIKDRPEIAVSDRQRNSNRRQEADDRKAPATDRTGQGSFKNAEPEGIKKIEPKYHQPFEPTNIPSPIYGFNRPIERKEKVKIPEFELNDFTSGTKSANEQESEVVAGPKEVGQQSAFDLESRELVEEIEQEGEPTEDRNFKEINGWNENNKFAESDELNLIPSESNGSKGTSVSIHELEDQYSSGAEGEEVSNEESGTIDLQEDNLPTTSTMEAVPKVEMDEHQTEGSSVSAQEEGAGHDTETPGKTSADITEKTGISYKEIEPSIEDKSEVTSTTSGVTDGNLQNEHESEQEEKKPRSHLPFNVLMLSQDRTKWQRQREMERRKRIDVVDSTVKTAEAETAASVEHVTIHYDFPPLQLLKPPVIKEENTEWLNEQAALLDETMENFNVKARVVKASQGPSVTRFEVQPDKGVKVNKITNLSNDIKLSMAARDIRMEAPIPGTRSIGIELPNKDSRPVQISEIIGKDAFLHAESPLTAALGLDISGEPVVTDLRKMPHGLIAGATGSGKSVCINSILVSLLYKARPDELKLLLVDPKMVELAPYNHIPHLVSPVITDVKAATAALKWAVDEMERRYELFVHAGVRDIGRFNYLAETKGKKSEHLPYIVIVIDELADLMMVAPAEVEESICRIAQKARACGIHLLIATQRPSVDVITGLIKANVPTRIAFAVSSQVDSRTVIDVSGAEKLLGRGDMLFLNNGSVKPVRLQGTFVSDEEIDRVIDHVRSQGQPNYLFQQEELLKKAEIQENEDELLMDACEFVVKQGNASTSLLQRQFRIGYNRAARLMEMMEVQGVISGANGSKPRDVLIKEADLDLLKDTLVH